MFVDTTFLNDDIYFPESPPINQGSDLQPTTSSHPENTATYFYFNLVQFYIDLIDLISHLTYLLTYSIEQSPS
jgi:hypothetical protein